MVSLAVYYTEKMDMDSQRISRFPPRNQAAPLEQGTSSFIKLGSPFLASLLVPRGLPRGQHLPPPEQFVISGRLDMMQNLNICHAFVDLEPRNSQSKEATG